MFTEALRFLSTPKLLLIQLYRLRKIIGILAATRFWTENGKILQKIGGPRQIKRNNNIKSEILIQPDNLRTQTSSVSIEAKTRRKRHQRPQWDKLSLPCFLDKQQRKIILWVIETSEWIRADMCSWSAWAAPSWIVTSDYGGFERTKVIYFGVGKLTTPLSDFCT